MNHQHCKQQEGGIPLVYIASYQVYSSYQGRSTLSEYPTAVIPSGSAFSETKPDPCKQNRVPGFAPNCIEVRKEHLSVLFHLGIRFFSN